ncbi:GNAT family N-acetyltransferase [Cupriavidus pauculus]|jgi:ribosomal protein S18 acetylase RimI-like enzyme|uniref:GNAT family N-acetyltransferase n=1 Tax=Cupriavidus pauculus TaxID=82633 RepID=UPI0007832445|nr:GNAT family N-acetyltransferase [Cupriavidus pauculus]MBY4731263.1 GNAT family N-acetyltransferase [Cupriavidus pauculus]MCM3606506.1 GNAT family N-acetyltransferase [Cupriavidus pauculus]UAL00593.1 GNAT family N-acetyltransferase [Cupriavidus pauculus]
MPLIELVPASPADADLLAAMHADSWRHAYAGLIPAEYLEHHAANERRITWRARMLEGAEAPLDVTILRIDGQPAGFSCLMPLAEPGYGVYVDNLHVLHTHHGKGYGKQLMAHCAARVASQWPGKPLFLYVLEGNTQAREFYRRLGGVESDSFNDPFPGTDLMVAIRRVTWDDVDALVSRLAPGP